MITDINSLKNISDKEFFDNFSYIMHVALIKDEGLYFDLIDQMYEICERNESVLDDVLNRCVKDIDIIKTKDIRYLEFGKAFSETLKLILGDKYTDGEYLSLGCVMASYISYIRSWLTKDEYYEIRDMFVPFYLPISIEMLDIDNAVNTFNKYIPVNENGKYTLALIKKVGKCVIDDSVSIDDITKAFNEINFDEAW